MKKTIFCAALLAASLSVTSAHAQESNHGFYVAPEVGLVKLKNYCIRIPGVSCSDSEIGFGVSGGYFFNEFFAVEAGGYLSSGFDISGAPGKVDVDLSALRLGIRGRFPLGEHVALNGKVGASFWEADYNASGDAVVNLIDGRTDDGTDLYFGAGGEFMFTDSISAHLEYTRYSFEDVDADVLSASVVFRF